MSTAFKPIEIPPGVVAKATKKMRSSNWAEVNLMRWREGQLMPMGGQSQMSSVVNGVDQYKFASKCRRVHGWLDINGVYHIAYLCEQNIYVDTGGQLAEITPVDGLAPPSGLSAGYGDGLFSPPPPAVSIYGNPPAGQSAAAITRMPDAYSLDNFGGLLYAMTSADQRLLMWDPASGGGLVGGVTATASFANGATTIYTTAIPATVIAGMVVTDTTLGQTIGAVAASGGVTANSQTVAAAAAFTTAQSSLLVAAGPAAGIGPGMTVKDTVTGQPVGTIANYSIGTGTTLAAQAAFTTNYAAISMPPNPGGLIPGLTVRNLTTSQTLGTVQSYGPINFTRSSSGSGWAQGATTIHFNVLSIFDGVVPGMTIYDNDHGAMLGTVANVAIPIITLTAPAPFASDTPADILTFSSGGNHVLILNAAIAFNSSGAADSILVGSGSPPIITLTANALSPSSGASDSLQITGGSKLTLAAGATHASAGATDALSFGGNLMAVQPVDSGRGTVPQGRCFVVTQERFIFIFASKNDGTTAPDKLGRRLAWCDQENPGAWDYSNVVSQAGFLDVEPASPIVCADASRTGIIFWTAKKVYASRFLGSPYIYNYTELADGTTPWSPQSVTTTSSLTLWMSEQGVYSYDGTSVLPVQCLLRPWIDDNIDPVAVRELSFAAHLGEFNEWWWFYPTLNSPFNTRAVVYNYKDGWWTQVQMSRSAGITSSYTSESIFTDDYVAFKHEVYKAANYANASMPVVLPFAETFDLNLGSQLMTVKQLIPDIEAVDPDTQDNPQAIAQAIQNLTYSVYYRNSRSIGDAESRSAGVFRPNGYVDFRVTGRDLRLRIDVGAVIQPFTIGAHLIDVVPRGDR